MHEKEREALRRLVKERVSPGGFRLPPQDSCSPQAKVRQHIRLSNSRNRNQETPILEEPHREQPSESATIEKPSDSGTTLQDLSSVDLPESQRELKASKSASNIEKLNVIA